MKSHKLEVAITPTRKQCRLSPGIRYMGAQSVDETKRPASAGTLGKEDAAWERDFVA